MSIVEKMLAQGAAFDLVIEHRLFAYNGKTFEPPLCPWRPNDAVGIIVEDTAALPMRVPQEIIDLIGRSDEIFVAALRRTRRGLEGPYNAIKLGLIQHKTRSAHGPGRLVTEIWCTPERIERWMERVNDWKRSGADVTAFPVGGVNNGRGN